MSLSAQDIVALARAGYNAEQISLLNRESSTPSTEVSTPSTPSTQSTESTEEAAPSTTQEAPAQPEAPEEVKPAEPVPAAPARDLSPAAPDPAPTMKDIMAELAALKNSLHTAAINRDQQPGQEDRLTGEQVLANIIDPRQK